MGAIDERLIAGVGVDRGDHSLLEAEGIVEHLHHGCEAVGGARCVRHHVVRRRVEFTVVHADHERGVGARRWGGHDRATGTGREMSRCVVSGGERAGRLDDQVDTELCPGQIGGVALCEHRHLAAIEVEYPIVHVDVPAHLAVHGVIPEEVGERLDVAEIVHRNDFERGVEGAGALAFDEGTNEVATDAAETVDGDTCRHGTFPRG